MANCSFHSLPEWRKKALALRDRYFCTTCTTYGHLLLRLSGCTIPFQLAMGQISRLVRLLLTSPSWCEYIAISQTISPTVYLQLLLCIAIYMAINFNVHQHHAWYMIQKALVLPTLHSHWYSLLFSVCYFQSIRTGWDSRRFLCCRAVSRWASDEPHLWDLSHHREYTHFQHDICCRPILSTCLASSSHFNYQ